MAKVIDPETILPVKDGFATIRLEQSEPVAVDPDALFVSLDRDRQSGALKQTIGSGAVCYQVSLSKSGLLEACHPDGRIELGLFVDGKFVTERNQ